VFLVGKYWLTDDFFVVTHSANCFCFPFVATACKSVTIVPQIAEEGSIEVTSSKAVDLRIQEERLTGNHFKQS
jgi:hypothetical protein